MTYTAIVVVRIFSSLLCYLVFVLWIVCMPMGWTIDQKNSDWNNYSVFLWN